MTTDVKMSNDLQIFNFFWRTIFIRKDVWQLSWAFIIPILRSAPLQVLLYQANLNGMFKYTLKAAPVPLEVYIRVISIFHM